MKKTQGQMFRAASQRTFDQNEIFMAMVKHETHPLTKKELRILIEKHPSIWARFANWLESDALQEE